MSINVDIQANVNIAPTYKPIVIFLDADKSSKLIE